MDAWQDTLSLVFGGLVTFVVPAVVWGMMLAGVVQLFREAFGRLRPVWRAQRHLVRGRQAG